MFSLKTKKTILNLIAVLLGFTFFGAGMAKLYADHQYFGWIGPTWLIERLEEYQLGFYGQFIALSQIFIGYLLITTRYKLLGSIMLIPMILNILMITISLEWKGTPFVLGGLLFLNFLIIWHYRDFFTPIINEGRSESQPKERQERNWKGHLVWTVGLALQFVSISISFTWIVLAFSTSLIGIIISLLSFRVDKIK
ncbi:hypothetical protein E4S40_11390 [Algoriphagus kandeliae]|uniref:DoxX family protein n=1 Tax=Algoriphagus kandeliae TaxID=2562278 RepID=A0A4Y9QPP3_9BACT|nr:hypothetical protein [Algoriphagus kandeliae]TFV94611.1 hypothetical protein E4S40_11390 [Algoriphagus kandeliae]